MVTTLLDDHTKNQVAELISDIGSHGMVSAHTLALVDTAALVVSTVRFCGVDTRGHVLCEGNGCPVMAVWASPGSNGESGTVVDVTFCDSTHVWVRHIRDGEQRCQELMLDAPLIAQWVVESLNGSEVLS